jgi:hypothetical protein
MVYFQNLPLGEWVIQETQLGFDSWWRPVTGAEQTVVLSEPSCSCTLVTFVNEPLGCIDGYKINQFEEGLPNWAINAYNADTGETFSTVTDSTGYFRLQLPRGTWTVSEVVQDGWSAVTPSSLTVEVEEPFVCERVRFKNRTEYACLDVYKWDVYGSAGLPGWEITLQPAYGGQPITGITDGTGWVRFNMLSPGEYLVSETMQSGWAAVSPTTQRITLEATGRCSVVNFYNQQINNLNLGTGDVQVTLLWATIDDLDLWVTDPDGERIFYANPRSESGGILDVDANRGCATQTTLPVENIYWPTGQAPRGTYTVHVNYFADCTIGYAPISYRVRVLVDGYVMEFEGVIQAANETQLVTTFSR